MREHVDGTYLIYEDPYDKGWQTELLVVSEPWNIQMEGPIPAYFVEREKIEFEDLWKLQDSETIVPSGVPQYQVFMNKLTDPDSSNSPNPRRIEIQSLDSGNMNKLSEEITESSDSVSLEMEEMEEVSDLDTEDSDSSLQRLLNKAEADTHSKDMLLFSSILENTNTGCLDPEDLSIFSSVYDRDDDDDDTMARAMQNDMGVDQDEDMNLDDDTRLALHHCYLYPPDKGSVNASIQLTPPSMPKVPLEEGEIFNPVPQSNYSWQTYMCRYDTTPTNEPSIEMKPFPIL
ncbi:hypothetical protein EDD85DRAFT_956925 [Armillaria nabsnona]|nr:hypothetical protein EDD85DRAFT_956925 [Armillaria nabsnona]